MYTKYHEKGLEIVDIPCNQFGGQAPGTDDEIHEFKALLEKMFAEADPEWDKKPDIKWNFTKFIIDREGNVVARFEPTADVKDVEACITSLL